MLLWSQLCVCIWKKYFIWLNILYWSLLCLDSGYWSHFTMSLTLVLSYSQVLASIQFGPESWEIKHAISVSIRSHIVTLPLQIPLYLHIATWFLVCGDPSTLTPHLTLLTLCNSGGSPSWIPAPSLQGRNWAKVVKTNSHPNSCWH